ncbi:hypothetical protein SynTAK9802_02263 [Synechococcus sp. TAK9802]|nr:hypothetical protein SynTAK9802_02263 [Synechococcus sp. TAK9802]
MNQKSHKASPNQLLSIPTVSKSSSRQQASCFQYLRPEEKPLVQ